MGRAVGQGRGAAGPPLFMGRKVAKVRKYMGPIGKVNGLAS